MSRFRAILTDIDGTLVFQGQPVPGAPEAIAALRRAGTRVRFATNISARPPQAIAEGLQAFGIDADASEIVTSATACADLLRSRRATCRLYAPPAVRSLFGDIAQVTSAPDAIVLGDLGDGFTYAVLDEIFTELDRGAELIALHRGAWWYDGQRKRLDLGAFVCALEAASGRAARVTGKPSQHFFEAALRDWAQPDETLIVGDDYATDILGAREIGAQALWVRTGKGGGDPAGTQDPRIASIAELPAFLGLAA